MHRHNVKSYSTTDSLWLGWDWAATIARLNNMNVRRKYKMNRQWDLEYLAKFVVSVIFLGVSLSTAQIAAGDTIIRDGNYRVAELPGLVCY